MNPLQDPSQIAQDGLWGHLCATSGLYARETFLSLVGCVTRMIRDYPMKGFALCNTLGEPAFESLLLPLENQTDVPLFRLPATAQMSGKRQIGFIIVLTDRLCNVTFWSPDKRKLFKLYEGGWTFHPGDSKTVAQQLIKTASDHSEFPIIQELLENTIVDRRYDDRFNMLINTLVSSLEQRNRELIAALDEVQDLNQQMVDQERLAAIGQLCSVIAHEIRNPLGLIDLYAKLIEVQTEQLTQDLPEDEQQKTLKNIQLIRQSIGSLETILSELTAYSRPAAA